MILEVVQFLLECRDITTFTTYNLQIDVSQKKKKKKNRPYKLICHQSLKHISSIHLLDN